MKNLFYLFGFIFLFSSCAEEDKTAQEELKTDSAFQTIKQNDSLIIVPADSMISMTETVEFLYASDGETCVQATERAARDTANGILCYYTFGYPADMCAFSLWHSILEKEYGIKAQHLGCVVSGWESCYDEVMSIAIEKKFGPDIWKNVNRRVDSVCELRMRPPVYLREEPIEIPVIEYDDPDRFYAGPRGSFGNYVGTLAHLPRSFRHDSLRREIGLLCQIDTSGKLRSWEYISGEKGSTEYYDSITPLMRRKLDRAVKRAAKKAYWIIPKGTDGKKKPMEAQAEIRLRWKEDD